MKNERGSITAGVLVLVVVVSICFFVVIGGQRSGQAPIQRLASFIAGFFSPGESSYKDLDDFLENVQSDELLQMMENSEIKLSSGDEMALKIQTDTFKYLLKKCADYDAEGEKTVDITVEGFHEYQVWVEESGSIDETGTETGGGGYWEDEEEYVTKTRTVSNKDFESGQKMDWRLLYLYCMIYRSWPGRTDTSLVITQADVDEVFEQLKMKYQYEFDVVRSGITSYSYTDCQNAPHTEDIYGDPDTEEGRYTWYYPHSQLTTANSGYSVLNVTTSGDRCTGVTEVFSPDNFKYFQNFIQPGLEVGYVYSLAKDAPGGERVYNRFMNYWNVSQQSSDPIATWESSVDFVLGKGDYSFSGKSYSYGGVVGGEGVAGSGFFFSGHGYSTIGEAAVALALSRLDWKYAPLDEKNNKRDDVGWWDCSSMVYRIYKELGVDISGGLGDWTSPLLQRARQMHKEVSEEELQPGDLIFIKTKRGVENKNSEGVGHVVMWAGNGMIVHAKGSAYGTRHEPWQTAGYLDSVICYARPYIGETLPEQYSITGELLASATDWGGTAPGLSNLGVAKRVWTFFKKQKFSDGTGWSDIAVAAIIGNMEQECSLDPTEIEAGSGKGFGLIQWTDGGGSKRRTNFENWMTSHGYSFDNVEAQCMYIIVEGDFIANSPITSYYSSGKKSVPRTSFAKSFKEFAQYNYSSLEDATRDFGYCSERMDEESANWPRRIKGAEAAYSMFAGKTSVTNSAAKAVTGTATLRDGQYINFSDFANAEFAEFSALHTGHATYYEAPQGGNGITVCVNAGHGTPGGTSKKTQAHPDGSKKFVSGTNAAGETMSYAISTGTDTKSGVSEESVNLKVSVLLASELLGRGYNVVMIRDNSNQSPVLDNIARTVIANQTSDCHLALHFDGDGLSYDKGCFFMGVPDIAAYKAMYPVSEHWREHDRLGKALVDGMAGRGVKKFSGGRIDNDLTQTSYSTIPSVDIEYGNQSSNFTDDYLNKIALGLADGVDAFFGN